MVNLASRRMGANVRYQLIKALMNKLRHYRLKAGIRQAELANMAGISQPMISAHETGKARMSWDFLQKCANVIREKGIEVYTHDLMEENIVVSTEWLLARLEYNLTSEIKDKRKLQRIKHLIRTIELELSE